MRSSSQALHIVVGKPPILATETENDAERNALMAEIREYNEEDLAATWAVFEWLRGKGGCWCGWRATIKAFV